VIVAVPIWFAIGVTITVRLVPVPLTTMLLFGINVVLLLLAVTVNISAAGTEKARTIAICCMFVAALSVDNAGDTKESGEKTRLSKTSPFAKESDPICTGVSNASSSGSANTQS
jgi:hypothetical protein